MLSFTESKLFKTGKVSKLVNHDDVMTGTIYYATTVCFAYYSNTATSTNHKVMGVNTYIIGYSFGEL